MKIAKKPTVEVPISDNGAGCVTEEVIRKRDYELCEEQRALQPPPRPAKRRIEWIWGLQNREDASWLQSLRNELPHHDDLVANPEPDMWVVETERSPHNGREIEALFAEDQRRLGQLRSRLLDLALELEHGTIVHHRAIRVSALNQLRGQAIKNLRSQASEKVPQALPGPEASQWVQWACSLRDPEDAEAIQTIRNGFAHLDEFAARLDPNMWKPAESSPSEIPGEAKRAADRVGQEQPTPRQGGLKNLLFRHGLYPSGGRTNGLDVEDWLAAEEELHHLTSV